ncbi:MAG: glycosyltransferase [Chloroflexi bacterium]|jgi:glycosyltransferase involved in cell wall biosynthesis|nr:MAG: glycosyltransferase [Chloroflexota bacterium]
MQKPITVVQIIPGLIVGDLGGGLELYAIRLAQALDKTRFHVYVATLWRFQRPVEQQWEQELRTEGIHVLYGASFQSHMLRALLAAGHSLWPLIRQIRPAIIHSHGEYAGIVGMALTQLHYHPPLIRTCHTTLEFPRHAAIRYITNALYPLFARAQVGVSSAVTDQLRHHPLAKMRRHPILYISNGIDLHRIKTRRNNSDLRQELHLDCATPIIGVVGRLTPQKGIPNVLQAFAQLRLHWPTARLIIVGTGYGQKPQMYQHLAHTLGISEYVHWLGARTDAIEIIAHLDVLVSSSLWEGLPTVILEAMALGTPVVATDIAGTRELIKHEHTGLLVPPQQPAALAAAIDRLLRDRTLAQQLAAAACHQVEQFSITQAARQYERLYLEISSRVR